MSDKRSEKQVQSQRPRQGFNPKTGQEKTKYIKRRRAPSKPLKTKPTIFIHRKSDFKSQLEKCQKLLDKGEKELMIHGLGAAINRAINIALQLQVRSRGTIQLSTNTSSVDLIEDLEPLLDELEPQSKSKTTSAVHIKVHKIQPEELLNEKEISLMKS